jgi:DNA-binding NtrC family response regulator
MQILIIEPNTFRLRQIKLLLTALGKKSSDIEGTDSAEAGLSSLRSKRFGCCFLAASLSTNESCVRVIEQIREGMMTRSVPIIVFGEATEGMVMSATKAGAWAFLGMPLSLEAVENVIRQVLEK